MCVYEGSLQTPAPSAQPEPQAHPASSRERLNRWNCALDQLAPYTINERGLVALRGQLAACGTLEAPLLLLALSRLSELVLLCLGNYVDSGEFSAAGDLLVNPRRILIAVEGWPAPLIKHRHGRLTDQLKEAGLTREEVLRRSRLGGLELKTERAALLPSLHRELVRSGGVAGWYLDHVYRRMQHAAGVLGRLAGAPASGAPGQRLHGARPTERAFIEGAACCFHRKLFERLGREIRRQQFDPGRASAFITPTHSNRRTPSGLGNTTMSTTVPCADGAAKSERGRHVEENNPRQWYRAPGHRFGG